MGHNWGHLALFRPSMITIAPLHARCSQCLGFSYSIDPQTWVSMLLSMGVIRKTASRGSSDVEHRIIAAQPKQKNLSKRQKAVTIMQRDTVVMNRCMSIRQQYLSPLGVLTV